MINPGLAPLTDEERRAIRATLGPRFASEEQRAFLHSQAREVLYSGWMGAGKSRILCEKAWHLAKLYPGITVGVFRKVAASLPATTLRTFLRDVVEPHLIAKRNLTEGWYELLNGSRIYFLGLDPDPATGVPSKIGSLELAWAGVDEAVEVTEGDWMMILGRLRDPRIPYHQIAAATNPAHPKHWLLLRFTSGVEGTVMLRASGNRFLPPDYQGILDSLPDNAIGRRLAKGEWAAVEGTIWRMQDWQVQDDATPSHRTVAGLDWGFSHLFAMEVVGVSSTGRMHVKAELTARHMGIDQIAPGVATVCEAQGVQTIYADPSEPGLMDQLRRELGKHRDAHALALAAQGGGERCTLNVSIQPANNDVAAGLQAVDKALRGGMTVSPACAQLLTEIPGYTWKPKRGGGFEEVPVDVNDDACDALRYAVMAVEPSPDNPWAGLKSAGGVG